jgi:hypothetical protein
MTVKLFNVGSICIIESDYDDDDDVKEKGDVNLWNNKLINEH